VCRADRRTPLRCASCPYCSSCCSVPPRSTRWRRSRKVTNLLTALGCALACGLVAAACTGWIRRVADSGSAWITRGTHVVLAAAGGAGASGLPAVSCGLLMAIALAVYRLPDVIVGPMYPALLAALVVAAAVSGDWGALGRALAAAGVLLAGYFALAWINPSGLGLGDVKLS